MRLCLWSFAQPTSQLGVKEATAVGRFGHKEIPVNNMRFGCTECKIDFGTYVPFYLSISKRLQPNRKIAGNEKMPASAGALQMSERKVRKLLFFFISASIIL